MVNLQDTVLSYRMVKKWVAEFTRDRESLEDKLIKKGLLLSPLKSLTKSMTWDSQIGV